MNRTPAPTGFTDEVFEHEGGGDAAHKDALRLSVDSRQREINGSRRSTPLETEQCRDVHAIPDPLKRFGSVTLDEKDIVAAAVGP